jgi:hypothetical protein
VKFADCLHPYPPRAPPGLVKRSSQKSNPVGQTTDVDLDALFGKQESSDPESRLKQRAKALGYDSRDYLVGDLWVPRFETRNFNVDILSLPGFEFDSWSVVSAQGKKLYWLSW